MVNENSLINKTALVTGAGSGIGAAVSARFAAAKAKVCCADINLDAAQRTADEINRAGGEAFAVEVDVAQKASNLNMVDAVLEKFNGLDCVHLNAGILATGPISEVDEGTWDRVMAVNLRGVLFGLQAVLPALKAGGEQADKGGAVVVTGSTSSLHGDANMSVYSASKHGVAALVKCAAVEFAVDKIRVNAIAPGAVATPMVTAHTEDIGVGTPLANMHPIGRVGTPEEMAELVVFLCSEQASFITGAIYPIDGGVSAVVNPRFIG